MKKKQTIVLIASFMLAIGFFALEYYHSSTTTDSPINDTLVTFLQEYIRIDTTHPTPDYDTAIAFLKKHAQADGFITQEVILPSHKKVLIITYPGTDTSLPALALNHHMDVVPAKNNGWISPPFAGEIHHDEIIGRGTQDMKGIGTTHYFALKELKQQGIIPRRTIHIFAVPDEEIGGLTGSKQFVQTSAFKKLNIGAIIDEGHASGDATYLDIKVAERKPIQIHVTVIGSTAHGSHLLAHNAIHDLVQFLHEIVTIHVEEQKKIGLQQPGELLSCNISSLTAGIKKKMDRLHSTWCLILQKQPLIFVFHQCINEKKLYKNLIK